MSVLLLAQGSRPASPDGVAATQVGGKYAPGGEAPQYQNGKWVEIVYGRPIKRGRDLWGAGANYGRTLNDGAPVWRAGANVSTRLKTEAPLVINGKTVPAGEYSLFIDLKENNWTFVVSTLTAQAKYDPNEKVAVWGAYNYTPDKDVLRAKMNLEVLPHAHEQLSWEFVDMTRTGGTIALTWDKTQALVPFTFGS